MGAVASATGDLVPSAPVDDARPEAPDAEEPEVHDVEVVASRARYRRWIAVGVAAMLAAWPAIFVAREGAERWASLLLPLLAAALLVDRWERLRLDDDGITLRRWPRHRTIGWDDVARVRIDWSDRARALPSAPLIELRDGEVVRSGVLGGVTPRFGRGAERAALLDRLRAEAAVHRFEVEVEPAEIA